jgi:glutathione S-transferase
MRACPSNHFAFSSYQIILNKTPQIQPPFMPRPDLASISVAYRRMPLLALGKDVYIDSRLILSKLESLYPSSPLTPSTPAGAGIKALFESYNTDGGIFANCVKLMPYWFAASALQNKAFVDDRARLSGGRRMTAEAMEKGRPDALQHMRQVFELLETTFLADGRSWILGSEGPSTADIDAVWPFAWLLKERGMAGALPEEFFNAHIYPKTYAWVGRFMNEVAARRKDLARPPTALDGQAMKSRVLASSAPLQQTSFSDADPLGLRPGDTVEAYPTDYGQAHRDRGTLVGLTVTEVVIRNEQGLHIHLPRWNFRVAPVGEKGKTKL